MSEVCSGEKRHFGQIRKPLSLTTIQEKGLLGNRISLRNIRLFSVIGVVAVLSLLARSIVICAAVPYSELA